MQYIQNSLLQVLQSEKTNVVCCWCFNLKKTKPRRDFSHSKDVVYTGDPLVFRFLEDFKSSRNLFC